VTFYVRLLAACLPMHRALPAQRASVLSEVLNIYLCSYFVATCLCTNKCRCLSLCRGRLFKMINSQPTLFEIVTNRKSSAPTTAQPFKRQKPVSLLHRDGRLARFTLVAFSNSAERCACHLFAYI